MKIQRYLIMIMVGIIFFCVLTTGNIFALSDNRIQQRIVPTPYERGYDFLELIKRPNEPTGVFNAADAPNWDVPKAMSYISRHGITFTDVNGRLEGHMPKTEVEKQLRGRKGDIFSSFSHLSHIYSIPYKQYSELRFEKTDGGFIIYISDWYCITFVYENGIPYLTRWAYLQLQGD